ncbi:protein NETWORKED 4A-like [Salvia divinorum]|uniref:Protein NETWORKED 4A-like n=1 Tax=Salvia divinorum TaxID=28513 RepID=A0ABD1HRC6_SALDI
MTSRTPCRSLVPDMDHHVKRMLKLIDEDADTFTKKVELYYQRRPELIALLEDLYRMYRSLAERYDHVTGDLRKTMPSDLQSQCSGITDLGSDPPSTMPSPGTSRAPGFDFFLGNHAGVIADVYGKEGDDQSSILEFGSESDDSPVNYYSSMHSNDDEVAKERSAGGNGEVLEPECKILTLWEEHRLTREKLLASEQEVARLRQELTSKGFPVQNLQHQLKVVQKELSELREKLDEEKDETAKLQETIARYKADVAELEARKAEMEETYGLEIERLKAEIEELQVEEEMVMNEKDDRIDQMSSHLHQMQVEQVDLMAGAEGAHKVAEELRLKIKELEREVEKKQQIIAAGAEEKREAIRQLCFSLEHYRNGYHRLRDVVMGQNATTS